MAGERARATAASGDDLPEAALRVAVLSCGELGAEVATRLDGLPEVDAVALATAPYSTPELGWLGRLRRSIRYDGVVDTLGAIAARLVRTVTEGLGYQRGDPAPEAERETVEAMIQHRHFSAFEAPDCLDWLARFEPDLGVVAGTYVLPDRVFELPRFGSINLHMGKAPEYRGSAPGFWELYRCESSVGVTIHRVTDELDGGGILAQETFPLDEAPAGDPMAYLTRYRRDLLRPNGVRMLVETVSAIADGELEARSQDPTQAKTYPKPTHKNVWWLRLRVLRRRIGRRAKDVIGRVLFSVGLHRQLLRGRAATVLFHRVDDSLEEDPMSCSVDEFRAYCAFFERHFNVVSLGRLLEDLQAGADLTARLVITFDDGYRDNHRAAAPILEQLGLPAGLFLATGYIGSDGTPWWDRRHLSQPEWMSWSEVRSLQERGFEIGAHTRSHADLGTVEGEEADWEIEGARRDIAEKLGFETPFFSYPYGGPEHLSEANRRRVREAGYRCCLSAHGGAVHTDSDPFELPRMPVSGWYVSPYHFGTDLVLTALREPTSRVAGSVDRTERVA